MLAPSALLVHLKPEVQTETLLLQPLLPQASTPRCWSPGLKQMLTRSVLHPPSPRPQHHVPGALQRILLGGAHLHGHLEGPRAVRRLAPGWSALKGSTVPWDN